MARGISASVRKQVFEQSGGHCAICGRTTDYLQIQHILPFSAGGDDSAANLQVVCASCNVKAHSSPKEDVRAAETTAADAYRFEKEVAEAFARAGFSLIVEASGHENGIDIIARKKDPVSKQRISIAVQCKHTSTPLAAETVLAFRDELDNYRGAVAVLVVSQQPSQAARNVAERCGVRIFTLNEVYDSVVSEWGQNA